jgi:hypothetical protein
MAALGSAPVGAPTARPWNSALVRWRTTASIRFAPPSPIRGNGRLLRRVRVFRTNAQRDNWFARPVASHRNRAEENNIGFRRSVGGRISYLN